MRERERERERESERERENVKFFSPAVVCYVSNSLLVVWSPLDFHWLRRKGGNVSQASALVSQAYL